MPFIAGLRWRFRTVPFLAMLVVVAIGVSLGQWQLRRAAQKQAIDVKLTERATAPALAVDALGALGALDAAPSVLEFRHVRLRGEFLPQWPVYLDNRPYQSRAGLYVVMAFRLVGSSKAILVERGWLARDAQDRTHLPTLSTPLGMVAIEGTLRQAPGRVMQLGVAPALLPGAIVQNLDPAVFARASGVSLLPLLLEQTSAADDRLVRDWPRPSSGVDRHLGYAFQWYALAAMAFLFFVVTGFRRADSATK